ncbi:MAG: ABC transporter ATP-binding protein [Microcella sp.]|uniref:energy-coupling factor ABC transporter ATP-binding protein n=1 Tax=Microcella sp. TaxID=1913979 RepID=UPI0024C8D429|nr:ABC transporter ATP-binding protein [Microcella sp.]UYN82611.1 MAG: ABC transporter ATP-binding protein [Microcella sp.]
MIELRGVAYAYEDAPAFTLAHLDLDVAAGSITGIVGASGSGKTTLAKIIAGFIPATEGGTYRGTASVAGRVLADGTLSEAVDVVGLVTQNPFNQISGARFTVREEIAFGLENRSVERAEMIERVDAVADTLGLGPLLDRSPYALSGGQMQLVAIASMVVMAPTVLVMDEPTSQLDPAGTRMVYDVLERLSEAGTTVVIIEHKTELLHEHCDAIAVLAGGRIVLTGSPGTVFADDRLSSWGVGQTRITRAAREARDRGLLAPATALPVSVSDAVAVFGDEGSGR